MIDNKYKVGQKIKNGTIYAILDVAYYITTLPETGPASLESHEWDEKFTDWRNKPIYLIKLDEPTRSFTFEEYCEYAKDIIKKKHLREQYEKYPLNEKMSVPEDGIVT